MRRWLEANKGDLRGQSAPVPFTQEYLRRLDAACVQHGARTILVAKDPEGRTHAAVYLVHDKKCMYYLMSGGDPELRSSGAGCLAAWRSIELAHQLGVRFEFEGSMIELVEQFFPVV
jgi:hypothetical protein